MKSKLELLGPVAGHVFSAGLSPRPAGTGRPLLDGVIFCVIDMRL